MRLGYVIESAVFGVWSLAVLALFAVQLKWERETTRHRGPPTTKVAYYFHRLGTAATVSCVFAALDPEGAHGIYPPMLSNVLTNSAGAFLLIAFALLVYGTAELLIKQLRLQQKIVAVSTTTARALHTTGEAEAQRARRVWLSVNFLVGFAICCLVTNVGGSVLAYAFDRQIFWGCVVVIPYMSCVYLLVGVVAYTLWSLRGILTLFVNTQTELQRRKRHAQQNAKQPSATPASGRGPGSGQRGAGGAAGGPLSPPAPQRALGEAVVAHTDAHNPTPPTGGGAGGVTANAVGATPAVLIAVKPADEMHARREPLSGNNKDNGSGVTPPTNQTGGGAGATIGATAPTLKSNPVLSPTTPDVPARRFSAGNGLTAGPAFNNFALNANANTTLANGTARPAPNPPRQQSGPSEGADGGGTGASTIPGPSGAPIDVSAVERGLHMLGIFLLCCIGAALSATASYGYQVYVDLLDGPHKPAWRATDTYDWLHSLGAMTGYASCGLILWYSWTPRWYRPPRKSMSVHGTAPLPLAHDVPGAAFLGRVPTGVHGAGAGGNGTARGPGGAGAGAGAGGVGLMIRQPLTASQFLRTHARGQVDLAAMAQAAALAAASGLPPGTAPIARRERELHTVIGGDTMTVADGAALGADASINTLDPPGGHGGAPNNLQYLTAARGRPAFDADMSHTLPTDGRFPLTGPNGALLQQPTGPSGRMHPMGIGSENTRPERTGAADSSLPLRGAGGDGARHGHALVPHLVHEDSQTPALGLYIPTGAGGGTAGQPQGMRAALFASRMHGGAGGASSMGSARDSTGVTSGLGSAAIPAPALVATPPLSPQHHAHQQSTESNRTTRGPLTGLTPQQTAGLPPPPASGGAAGALVLSSSHIISPNSGVSPSGLTSPSGALTDGAAQVPAAHGAGRPLHTHPDPVTPYSAGGTQSGALTSDGSFAARDRAAAPGVTAAIVMTVGVSPLPSQFLQLPAALDTAAGAGVGAGVSPAGASVQTASVFSPAHHAPVSGASPHATVSGRGSPQPSVSAYPYHRSRPADEPTVSGYSGGGGGGGGFASVTRSAALPVPPDNSRIGSALQASSSPTHLADTGTLVMQPAFLRVGSGGGGGVSTVSSQVSQSPHS